MEEESLQPPRGSARTHREQEDWSHQLNERKAQWLDNSYVAAGFRCECWEPNCADHIRLSGPEWHKVTSRDSRFVVAPDHVSAAIESVVEEHAGFWIVDKKGTGRVAEELA